MAFRLSVCTSESGERQHAARCLLLQTKVDNVALAGYRRYGSWI